MQTTRATGQDLDVFFFANHTAVTQLGFALKYFFFLAKTHLRSDIRARDAQSTRLTAAAIGLQNLWAQQRLDGLHGVLQLHGAVARIVIQVGAVVVECHAFFKQVLMDVNDAAAWKNFVELIALQLVIAGAATDHHRFDVQVVQGVGHAVEQDPVVRDDFFSLVKLTAALLGVAAAQITRRQNRLHTGMPEHGLRSQANLAEQAF